MSVARAILADGISAAWLSSACAGAVGASVLLMLLILLP